MGSGLIAEPESLLLQVGDTVILELEAAKPLYGLIAASALTDSSFYSHSPSWVFLQPAENREEGRNHYAIPVYLSNYQNRCGMDLPALQ